MSLYTNWACFNCRKSFHRRPLKELTQKHKCPDCTKQTVNMGIYFEPPPRRAIKQWAIMQLLAEKGFRFHTEGGKVYIEAFILQTKRPRIADVRKSIVAKELARAAYRLKSHLEFLKAEKACRKRSPKI